MCFTKVSQRMNEGGTGLRRPDTVRSSASGFGFVLAHFEGGIAGVEQDLYNQLSGFRQDSLFNTCAER